MSEGTPAGLQESPAGSVQHGDLPRPVQRAAPQPALQLLLIVTNLFLQAAQAALLQGALKLGPEVGGMEKCIPGQRKGLKIF